MAGSHTAADLSTRRQIIQLLRTSGPLTAAALAQRLGISHVAVRRHLLTLERDGLVAGTVQRQPMGRPCCAYALTEAAEDLFPKKYASLSVEILDFLQEIDPSGQLVDRFFACRRDDLIRRYGPRVARARDLASRVALLAAVQTENGYVADWEDAGDSLVLKEFNCPVHAVSRKYDHACRHELEFFKVVLGTDRIERVECIARGGGCCRYVIARPVGE